MVYNLFDLFRFNFFHKISKTCAFDFLKIFWFQNLFYAFLNECLILKMGPFDFLNGTFDFQNEELSVSK